MLTRLRVQGFKNLLDLDLRFGAFTCIVGPNGAGKSNVFDAIRFLSLLTGHTIMEAAKVLRETKGRSPEPKSLLTTFESFRAEEMRFVADMVVGREVQDDFGTTAEASISSLRYELALRVSDDGAGERLELAHESLHPLKVSDARSTLGFPHAPQFRQSTVTGRRSTPLVTTDDQGVVRIHQDGHGGRKVPAPRSARTVVGGLASGDFPTVLAAHREMESWRTLMLEPSAMRAPSFFSDARRIDSRGGNLPSTLARLQKAQGRDGRVCGEVANRLAELIEDIRAVEVIEDDKTESWTVAVRGRDGVFHPARSLSDGTLRFLVLATISLDPEALGTICLEEPENGIHPERVPAIVRLLRDIAVDWQLPVSADNPPRQVIVNTHSPEVFRQVSPDDLIFLESAHVSRRGGSGELGRGLVALASSPAGSWRAKGADARLLAPGRAGPYLTTVVPEPWRQLTRGFADDE